MDVDVDHSQIMDHSQIVDVTMHHDITWQSMEEDFLKFWSTIVDVPAGLSTVEQGTPIWHMGRAARLTASNFGSVADLNPYCSANELLLRMVYPSFISSPACQWGNDMEPVACRSYLTEIGTLGPDSNVHHLSSGIHINPQYPFLGASPDGIVTVDAPVLAVPLCYECPVNTKYDLLEHRFDPIDGMVQVYNWQYPLSRPQRFNVEFKCPFRKVLYPTIPKMYYCQIQGVCQVIKLPYTHFSVWTPTKSSLVCYPTNDRFWHEFLYPKLLAFYFNRFLPFAFLKQMNLLQPGVLVPTVPRAVCQQLVAASRKIATKYRTWSI